MDFIRRCAQRSGKTMSFSWAPVIRVGDIPIRGFNAKEGNFARALHAPQGWVPLWGASKSYAQVLLETGEFAFID